MSLLVRGHTPVVGGESVQGGSEAVGRAEARDSPGEHQTQQGADEDEHLVEHGRVRPLDGPVQVILRRTERHGVTLNTHKCTHAHT